MITFDLTQVATFANHFMLSSSSFNHQLDCYLDYINDPVAFMNAFNIEFPSI